MDDELLRLHTIGHSNRTIEEFLDLVDAHGLQAIVDVRAFPGSRRLPHFGQELLAQALAGRGIDYHHERGLGGRRRVPEAFDSAEDDPGGAWRNASFRSYARYVQTPAYAQALGRLQAIARSERVAIMCSEAVPWRCHRWLVSDTLVAAGWQVLHVLDAGPARVHERSSFSHVGGDGRVTWPGPESRATLRLGPRVGTGSEREVRG